MIDENGITETAPLHRTIPFFELNEVSNVKLDFLYLLLQFLYVPFIIVTIKI